MKIRIKFKKEGVMKFIGHLDVMRYFQKLLRRSGIPIAYSTGMSPHQIMSFAMPLSIGVESDAEYVDIEITEKITSKDAIKLMNENNTEGIEILSFKELPDDAVNAMASISAADYEVRFRDGYKPAFSCIEAFNELYLQEEISVLKQSKKSSNIIDIKPAIYEYSGNDDSMFFKLSCGSVMNIKPELVMEAIFAKKQLEMSEFALMLRRKEIYTSVNSTFVSLDSIGSNIL